MTKEEQLLRNRFTEYADICYQREIPVYSDFLNLNEQTIFLSMVSHFPPVRFQLTGGYELAERKIVCLFPCSWPNGHVGIPGRVFPSYGEDTMPNPPISALKIVPSNKKFADTLTHRDYLGSIMNLGIERSKIGDILITESDCHVLCLNSMAPYLMENLLSVKHTSVERSIEEYAALSVEQRFEQIEGSIASIRLDNILALVYRSSRSKVISLISGEKVFVNGKLVISNSYHLKDDDIVSVRGLGKFVFVGVASQTKKGRYFVSAKKYC